MNKAVIFPGQGSQYAGMGKSLYDGFDQSKEVFDRMDKILGFSLSQKCFIGTEEELKSTSLQQLAILGVSLAAYEALRTKILLPAYVSGLSLGEYTCLYAAGCLSIEEVTLLVQERAQAMQAAAEQSAATMFAVIGLDKMKLSELSNVHEFYLANMNSPQQIAISLKISDKEKIKAVLEAAGAKVVELAVSGGFHSKFMEPAKQRLTAVIDKMTFKPAVIPIVSNYTACAHVNPDEIKTNLLNQLVSPVRWYECVCLIGSQRIIDFYEAGPNRILKGLMRKIDSNFKVTTIEKKEDVDNL